MAAEASAHSGGPVGASPSRAAGNIFDQQRRNRRDTWLLIAAFVALLAFIGFGFDLFLLGVTGVAHPGGVPLPVPSRQRAPRRSGWARPGSATGSETAPFSRRASPDR
jgi:hypothetical protein